MSRFRNLPARLAQTDPFDLAAAILFAAVAAFIIFTFRDYAVSNDEEIQHQYAQLIVRYYASGMTDQAVFHLYNLYLYGGLFDLIAVGLQHLLPFDVWNMRHLLCAFIGLGGIAAAWATARMIGGTAAGFLAAVLLVICGSYYGTIFNHTKDIPFAAAMMGSIYFLLRTSRDLPRPRWSDVIFLGLCTGGALGIRVTGFLLICYAGLMVLVQSPLTQPGHANWRARLAATVRYVWPAALRFLPGLAIAYAIMLAAWPWAALEPLNPLRGFVSFADFNYDISTLLAGHVYSMGDVPRWYIPEYFAVKLPILMLFGVALAVLLAVRPTIFAPANATVSRRQLVYLGFAALFPLACQVIAAGPAFTGLRHFTFLIPLLAVMAAVSLTAMISALAHRQLRLMAGAVSAVFAAAMLFNAITLVRLHPYEYLAFNEFVGGLPGAMGRYDTDYWANMMPEGVHDLESYLDKTDRRPGQHYTVAICSESKGFEEAARKDPRFTLTDDWNRADFFISTTHMHCDKDLQGQVIADVSRLGATIGVVKDRRAITRPEFARAKRQ